MLYQQSTCFVKSLDWDENRLAWLILAWFDGFGSKSLQKLSRQFRQDGERALRATTEDLRELGIRTNTIERFFRYQQTADVTTYLKQLERDDIRFILIDDKDYPRLLREINDPPFALFQRGATINSGQPCVTVVGTRNITPYGKHVTTTLCTELVRAGYCTASGLAFGVDATAHEATLDARGITIAVLGGGCDDDTIYPREHVALAHRLLKSGGTIISEMPPGTEPMRHHFPLRNRILAGLSPTTVVVEAAEASGSLITAHAALNYNREVFAVPGPITSAQSKGTNTLIGMGATPYLGPETIVRAERKEIAVDRTGRGTTRPGVTTRVTPTEENMTAEEMIVAKALHEPLSIDELTRKIQRPSTSISMILLQLEMRGIIEDLGGKRYQLRGSFHPTSD